MVRLRLSFVSPLFLFLFLSSCYLVIALLSCFMFPSLSPPSFFHPNSFSLTLYHFLLVFFFLFSMTPPSFGRGWGASGRPANPGTGCGSENGTHPWSRRRTGRWCGNGTGVSCKMKPLQRRGKKKKNFNHK